MKSKLLLIASILFFCLAGCADGKTVSTADSTSDISYTADVTSGNNKSDDISAGSDTRAAVSSEPDTEDISAVPSEFSEKAESGIPSKNSGKQEASESAETAAQPVKRPESSKPAEVPQSDESEETQLTEPPAVTEPPEEPEASEPSAPAFNIDYWVEYAESYAQSIGLEIDSSAADCWDNPISANADSKYLERDIKNRLDRYRRDESVSQVLIWSEPDGESSYLLYIGYS